jgi:hypothetical protein
MPTESRQGAIVFRPDDLAIIAAIQERTGLISRAEVVRYALRQAAIAAGIPLPKAKPAKKAKP